MNSRNASTLPKVENLLSTLFYNIANIKNRSHSIFTAYGSSIHDVTFLGGGRGCQGFCDDSSKALILKSVTMGGVDVENSQILGYINHG